MTDDKSRRAFLHGATVAVATTGLAGCLNQGSSGEETDDGMDDDGMTDESMGGETESMDDGMSDGTESMDDGMSETESMENMDETDGMDEETDGMDDESDGMDQETDGMGTHTFEVTVANVSEPGTITTEAGEDLAVPLSPVAYAVHTDDAAMFEAESEASDGLESLAEDGAPDGLAAEVEMADGVDATGTVATADGTDEPGPLAPGDSYSFAVEAGHDHRLTLATMFVQSNDLFYAPEPDGMALFADGEPVSGDVTDHLVLWDAGTEQNQEPGAGPDQAPRQSGPDTGPEEDGTVRRIESVMDDYDYPDAGEVIEVTVSTM